MGQPSSTPAATLSLRAVDLEPHVVAAAVVAGVGDDAEGAVREGHDGGGGVGVVVRAEEVRALVAAGGVDLDGVLPADPADDVEVVHPAVAVHPAGHRHVLRRRRFRVQGGGADGVDPAQLTAVDRRLGRGDRRVVAALEPDLHRHGRALEAAEQLGSLRAAGRHRLLAESGQARLDAGEDERRVGVRAGRDDHAVDARSRAGRPASRHPRRPGRRTARRSSWSSPERGR